MKFLTRNTTQSPFYTRPSVTLWDRRLTWLRWLGYLTCLIIVLQTSSYLFGYPETNIIQAVYAALHRPILRPCQYHGTVGVWDKVAGDDSPAPDALGMAHDRRDKRFYEGGTLTLTSTEFADTSHPVPLIYDPYPAYNSRKWKKKFHGKFQPCLGPRGRDLDRRSAEDMVQVYKGQQAGFPAPRFGSYEALDLDGNVCTDRYSRFGAYGYDDDGEDEVPGFTRPSAVPWCEVDWHMLQNLCLERNADRYDSTETVNYSSQSPLAFDLPGNLTNHGSHLCVLRV
ncbi:unnamed protein product [Penicillium nalgiovense]|nr:unnamed protein product [Penicillium nalgiovense]